MDNVINVIEYVYVPFKRVSDDLYYNIDRFTGFSDKQSTILFRYRNKQGGSQLIDIHHIKDD